MLQPSGPVLQRDVHWNQALSLSAVGEAREPPRPGKIQDRLESNIPLVCKETKRKKVQGLLSAIDIRPLQVSLPCMASSTLGWMEEGLPPSDTPSETRDFVTTAPNDILIHGDFSSTPFRGAVKSSSESYSAWETALSCLRACGPCQVQEPSEERLVTQAPKPSKFSNVSQAARMCFLCSLCLL